MTTLAAYASKLLDECKQLCVATEMCAAIEYTISDPTGLFVYNSDKHTYPEAKAYCESIGYAVASIHSDEENAMVMAWCVCQKIARWAPHPISRTATATTASVRHPCHLLLAHRHW